MRNDIIYEVFGVKADREKDTYFDSFKTVKEAEAWISNTKSKPWAGTHKWSDYLDDFVVREKVVDTDFVVPAKIRDRYRVTTETVKNRPGTWNSTLVHVLRDGEQICSYERNYSMKGTFEPFEQNGHDYALISPHYTQTSVLDLETGNITAEEPEEWWKKPGEDPRFPDGRRAEGFCPVGFYVPGWWDVHDDESVLPGSHYWDPAEDEWPTGDFGFVWGCVWGDDWSWKLQYLDLSDIANGVVKRDDRFGYLPVSSHGNPQDWISVESEGKTVTIDVPIRFKLTGELHSYYINDLVSEKGDTN